MGETYVSPETLSDNHHHGQSETAISCEREPRVSFHDGIDEVRIATAPGDYVFVPPYVPHREENPIPTIPR